MDKEGFDDPIETAIVAINQIFKDHLDNLFPTDYQALVDARDGLVRLQKELDV